MTIEEWQAMRNLTEYCSIIIKLADKGSSVVVWARKDYLAEGYKQLSDNSTYIEVKNYKENLLVDLTEKSNKIFKKLCNKNVITEKKLKYFTYIFKNTSCLGEMYLLPKIHKRLYKVPEHPVISNCGTPTEKISKFLDPHLQLVLRSYVKDTNHFLEKLKELGKVQSNAILVTADVVGLYPSIPHDTGLKALHEKLEERNDESVSTADLVNMADFLLKNNYFEFDSCIKQQISGTAIGTKSAPTYACIFMDKVESAFLE